GRCVIISMKPLATPVAKVVNPLGTVVTIQSDEETEKEQCEDAVIHENCDEALFRPIVAPKPILFSEGKPRTNPTDTMIVRSLDNSTGVAVKILGKSKDISSNSLSNNKKTKHITEENVFTKPKVSNRTSNENEEKLELGRPKQIEEHFTSNDTTDSVNISNHFDSFNYDDTREPLVFPDLPTLESFDCGLIFEESRDNFKDDIDFPYLEVKNDTDKECEFKSDMFEDASDCYDDLYINSEKHHNDKKENFNRNEEHITEEKVTPLKPRRPKAKLGVRIPNKNFPTKNEEDLEPLLPRRSWSSVAALKPKEKILDVSDKENCELLDLSDDKGSKKSFSSGIKNVKLIHIETPPDEDAAIEIVEPVLPEFRKNSWYSNVLDKSSDEEKLIDGSPGETTESDDSGKLPENRVTEDLISHTVIQTVSKAAKKKSKKKRK
ncbi:hypothetical protein HHI36_011474, partial [Cryptolaemus montrouzieri]